MDQYSTLFPEREAPPGEIAETGGYVRGFAGALLGALIGVIPWFLASTFINFFVGWLGFLVGVAACWGYRKLRGARRPGYAMTVVIVCSVLALVLAEFASWMFVLCTDPEWQADAAWYGIPVAQMALKAILMPENWHLILPGLAVGLLIGGLGIAASRRKVLEYTDPARTSSAYGTAVRLAAEAPTTGLPLPQQFVLWTKPSTRWLGRVCYILAVVFLLLFLLCGVLTGSAEALPYGVVLCIVALVEGALLTRFNKNYCLKVDGERLRFVSRTGKVREFTADDIAGMSVSNAYGRTLYGHDGQVLAKINSNMTNIPLLTQYLAEHDIPLRG